MFARGHGHKTLDESPVHRWVLWVEDSEVRKAIVPDRDRCGDQLRLLMRLKSEKSVIWSKWNNDIHRTSFFVHPLWFRERIRSNFSLKFRLTAAPCHKWEQLNHWDPLWIYSTVWIQPGVIVGFLPGAQRISLSGTKFDSDEKVQAGIERRLS